ncbi:DsbA family protein [Pseudaestuariivita sp.]|uniref:DsbA family protein n=1 Tax=Pseudaestuariivita sp. TaxID=2211669 RepID=UPI004057FD50
MRTLPSLLAASALSLTLSAPASAIDLEAMSAEERAAFGSAVRAYLLENPEVIMEAVAALEARQQAEQAAADVALAAQHMDALHNDGFSWVGGNPEGDITVVEFIDYRCGYCRRAHPEVDALLAADGNIRLIVKELPILGEASMTSSRFAIAVKQLAGGDAYKAAHDALIALNADPSDAVLTRLAEGLGLDAGEVLARMEADSVSDEIAQTRELARALQINGTPSFVFGDEMVRGYVPLDAMREIVAAERG